MTTALQVSIQSTVHCDKCLRRVLCAVTSGPMAGRALHMLTSEPFQFSLFGRTGGGGGGSVVMVCVDDGVCGCGYILHVCGC